MYIKFNETTKIITQMQYYHVQLLKWWPFPPKKNFHKTIMTWNWNFRTFKNNLIKVNTRRTNQKKWCQISISQVIPKNLFLSKIFLYTIVVNKKVLWIISCLLNAQFDWQTKYILLLLYDTYSWKKYLWPYFLNWLTMTAFDSLLSKH